jgi:excisionase family DNA binding protein
VLCQDARDEHDGEERRVSDESRDRRDRMTVPEAARVLGISEGAVRKRVERGKLQAEHTADGRLIVYLDKNTTVHDRVHDESHDITTERYVRSLEDQVEYLRQQLADERAARTQERQRHDTIVAQLTSRIPELPPATESSSPAEPPGAPTAATEEPERAEPRPATGGRQEGAERPWWRRMFGG